MIENNLKDWQVKPFEAPPEQRQGWVTEQIQDGGAWWEAQKTTANIKQNLDLLSAATGPQTLKSNNLKSDIRKFVETISDIREIGTLGTGAEQLKEVVEIENKVIQAIYRESHFARQDRKCLQWAVAANRGYMWPRYIRKDFGWGQGVFEFKDLAGSDVLPSQLPSDNDVQGAYAMTITDCMGIAEAHARFPRYQNELVPVAKTRPLNNTHVRRLETWDRFRFQNQSDWDRRFCEINYTFVRDLRINTTGKMLPMGDKGTSWYYEVPTLKSLIATTNPNNLLPESRTALPEDCRVYPQLRLLITNPGMSKPLYDGPAFDWHGMMPAVAYDVDDWPWLAVGYSLIQDIAGIERTQRAFVDLMWRVLQAKMNPPMAYDLDSGIPREDIKRFNLLDEMGTHVGVNGDPRVALASMLPETVKVDAMDFQLYQLLDTMRNKALGLNQLESMENLKFNLSSDNVEKLLETIGPVAKGISSNLEVSHAKIVYMLKYMIPQYLTTKRVMAYAGPDAIQLQVLNFDPNSILPSHLPGEESLKNNGKPSNSTDIQRAKWAADNLTVASVPSQLLNITHMQEQLKWLNLFQQGAPVPFCEVAKQLGIRNWGDSPGATLFEKYKWEQREMAIAKAEVMQAVAGELPPGAMGAPAPQNAAAQPEKNKPNGQGKGGGRPPTAQIPPKLETRGSISGKPRTVISQSK